MIMIDIMKARQNCERITINGERYEIRLEDNGAKSVWHCQGSASFLVAGAEDCTSLNECMRFIVGHAQFNLFI